MASHYEFVILSGAKDLKADRSEVFDPSVVPPAE
jgi:hypothetical protein